MERSRTSLYACIATAVAGMILSFFIHSPWSIPNIYSDIASFWGRSWLRQGEVPYIQSFFEYPPISGLLIYASRIIGGSSYAGYYSTFGILSIGAAGVLAWSCWRISKVLNSKLNPLYFLLPSMIVYGVYSFDLFHAMFIVLSLQMFLENKKSSSAVMLALAIATKLVSAVLIPIYLIELKNPKPILKYLAMILVPLGIIVVPLAVLNFSYFVQFYQYFKTWGLEDAWFVWIFQNPISWSYAKLFGLALMGLLLLETYTLRLPLIPKAFLALVSFLLGTYVYAPQFNLMLVPLIAVLAVESPSLFFWDIFNALIILTWFGTTHPTSAGTLPQLMSLLRAFALVWMSLSILASYGIKPLALFPRYVRRSYAPLLKMPKEYPKEKAR
jgi:hypothetical protein